MSRFDLGVAELRQYRPHVSEPTDFDDFWARTLQESRERKQPAVVEKPDRSIRSVVARDVRFTGWGGEGIAAWLITPGPSVPLRGAIVQFVGYGGGRGMAHEHLAWASAGYAHLVMDTRGQGSGWSVGVTPDSGGAGPSVPGMMTRGITSPETYYYRRLITDAVRAVETMEELDLVGPDSITVIGGSQGGGLALAAAGLAPRVKSLIADVPFLCHFGRAVGMTDAAPYSEIRDYLRIQRDDRDRVFETLSYFDGVNFARRATAPALFSVALEDVICPPSTVFAAANTYAGATEIDVYEFNGHEGGGAERWPRLLDWLERSA